MDGKALADHAVEYGRSVGADYIEARFIDSVNENYFARNGKFLGIQKTPNRGLGIRVLKGGGMGFGSLDQLEKDEVEDRVESITKMAELSGRREGIKLSEEDTVQESWSVSVKRPFEDISQEEKQEYVEKLDEEIEKSGTGTLPFRSKIKNRIIFLHMHTLDKYIVTSDGSKVNSDESFISLYLVMNAKTKNRREQRMLGKGSSSGWEWLEEENVRDFIAQEGEKLVRSAQRAEEMDLSQPIDVVVGPEVSGIMAHENVGHPSESDRIMGREAAQAGESFYEDILGEKGLEEKKKIGSDAVTVIDDPTMEGSPGYYEYDEECVEAEPRYLIKDGYLNDLLLNREYASVFNSDSNGAARAASYSREPIPRMSNTYFDPGEYGKEELIEDIDKGILMNSFTEWNIDDRRFHSKYVGLEAYLIENGEITDTMVKRPTLEITTPRLLKSVDAVSKNYERRMNFCGKSDPQQPVPVSTGGPYLKLKDMRVG
ncbi:MAG: TldD/PmbA family protein [Candidatus Thermoplasmatota archaeon]